MRLERVVVKNFQVIESADVELGPGLNVLYGPNDHGKSTLASAIRAAFLVPPSSTEARGYLSWFLDAVPEVTLTFADDDNHFWRVRKCYGATSAQSTADLHHSKDGVSFTRDCGGREVEDQLRKVLGWGIPSPGGKGAPKKLPTSFLAHVLLAEQADVETILQQSTEEDGTTSGRDRLRKALAALAEDPWFKKVLTETQLRVEAFFTPTGQRKRGRGSPFALAAEDVKRRADRVDELRKSVADSRAIEDHLQRLQDDYAAAREACVEATTALATVRQQYARAGERVRAEGTLADAKAAMQGVDRQASEVADRARALKQLEEAVAIAETHLADARTEVESAEATLRGAEEVLRAATSEDGAHQREVRRARLGEERAELSARAAKAEKRRDDVEAAQRTAAAATGAIKAKEAAQAQAERARSTEEKAFEEFVEAEEALRLARGIVAFGLWHAAEVAANEATTAKAKAQALRAEVVEKETAATQKETQALATEVDARARRERLPDVALTKRLEELEKQIAIAEGALGGGFSIVMSGSGKVPVHVAIDGNEAVAGTALDGRLVLDAARQASLRIGDVLELEVVAGAADKRRELVTLRERWINEAQPILERAGVVTPTLIRERLAETVALETTAASLRTGAKQLRTEAEGARQSASLTEQRADELLAHAGEAASLKARLEELDQQLLATSFAKLGAAWKQPAEQLVASKERAALLAREEAEKQTRARDMAAYRATDAAQSAATAEVKAEAARTALALSGSDFGAATSEALDRALAEARADVAASTSRHAAIGEELGALDQEASSALTTAKATVEQAKAKRDGSLERHVLATKGLDDARSRFHTASGEVEALRKAFESVDRAGVEARVAAAQVEVDAYAGDVAVTAEQVEAAVSKESQATGNLARLRGELNHGEGALTKVGGLATREELAREEEARALANERQRELEIDADAWKLLRETLDQVEKEGSTHLGRSLEAPVSARLVELTQGRYSGLRLDQHLKAETVVVPLVAADGNVLEALSVGTRGQIATLLRLTVAEQLKSAIILDDHLVHTDPERLAWFRTLLRKTALSTQIIVLTCRPQDYAALSELPDGGAMRDLAGGTVRTIDASLAIQRGNASLSTSPLTTGAVTIPQREVPVP